MKCFILACTSIIFFNSYSAATTLKDKELQKMKNSIELEKGIKEKKRAKTVTFMQEDYFSLGTDEEESSSSKSSETSTAICRESFKGSYIRFTGSLQEANGLNKEASLIEIFSWIKENTERIKAKSGNKNASNPSVKIDINKDKKIDYKTEYAADLITILNNPEIQKAIDNVSAALESAQKQLKIKVKNRDYYIKLMTLASKLFEKYEELRKILTEKFLAVAEISVPAIPESVVRNFYIATIIQIIDTIEKVDDIDSLVTELKEIL